MLNSAENTELPLPMIFVGYEFMGSWKDQASGIGIRKTWVRFFSADSPGCGGRDALAFNRVFDALDCLILESLPTRSRLGFATSQHGHWDRCRGHRFWVRPGQDLTSADRGHISEILGAGTIAPGGILRTVVLRDELTPAARKQIAEILAGNNEEELE